MGALNVLQLAMLHPRLLEAVIPIEPIIHKHITGGNLTSIFVFSVRRDTWPSRAEAEAYLKRSALHRTWDRRALDALLQHGLRNIKLKDETKAQEDEPVTLVTSKAQESYGLARSAYPAMDKPATSFVPTRRTHFEMGNETGKPPRMIRAFYRPEGPLLFKQLPHLRPQCLWVWGAKSTMESAQPVNRAERLGITGTGIYGSGGQAQGAVREVVVQDGTHFTPFEKPVEVAVSIRTWLVEIMVQWRKDEAMREKRWRWSD